MDHNDGPSPPSDQHTPRSSGGESLSLEQRLTLVLDKMERQSQQIDNIAAALNETQRQSAEAKASKYLFYKFFSILFAPYPLYCVFITQSSMFL